jgi:hypothetical protein
MKKEHASGSLGVEDSRLIFPLRLTQNEKEKVLHPNEAKPKERDRLLHSQAEKQRKWVHKQSLSSEE